MDAGSARIRARCARCGGPTSITSTTRRAGSGWCSASTGRPRRTWRTSLWIRRGTQSSLRCFSLDRLARRCGRGSPPMATSSCGSRTSARWRAAHTSPPWRCAPCPGAGTRALTRWTPPSRRTATSSPSSTLQSDPAASPGCTSRRRPRTTRGCCRTRTRGHGWCFKRRGARGRRSWRWTSRPGRFGG